MEKELKTITYNLTNEYYNNEEIDYNSYNDYYDLSDNLVIKGTKLA